MNTRSEHEPMAPKCTGIELAPDPDVAGIGVLSPQTVQAHQRFVPRYMF